MDELLADISSGHRIEATVFVEAHSMYRADGPETMRSVGEVEFVNGVAAMSASGQYGPARLCAGIVGYADLRLGPAWSPFSTRIERAGGGRFRGMRHNAANDPDVRIRSPLGHAARARLSGRLRPAAARGLRFDAWTVSPATGRSRGAAAAVSRPRVVLNHVGGRIGVGRYAGDRPTRSRTGRRRCTPGHVSELHVKLGGLGMAMAGYRLHERPEPPTSDDLPRAWEPCMERAIELFGPARCMFESNFPVDKASCSYGVLWNAFKKIAAPLPASAQDRLFYGTAASFYAIYDDGRSVGLPGSCPAAKFRSGIVLQG